MDDTKPHPFTPSNPDEVLTIGSDEKSDWFRVPKRHYDIDFRNETETHVEIRVPKKQRA
ncbi:MAG TPA: hypothetical protein VF762_14300 [Blastocatellia bacterium]|jgi:hypothetical protein